MPRCTGTSLSPTNTRYVQSTFAFKKVCTKRLLTNLYPFCTLVQSRSLHKQEQSSQTEDGSFDGMAKSEDSSGESKMPSSWQAFRRAHQHHHHNQQHQKQLDKQSHSAEETAERLNAEILGDADSSSSLDNGDVDKSGGQQVSPSIANIDAVLAEEGLPKTSAGKVEESIDAKLERLIRELKEDSKREQTANQVDASFQQAEAVKAKLDFEINRTRLILMRLRSLQRNVADAHFLAKKLVESDAVSKNIKDYALTNLDKSVETVKKVLVKM